jgi:hypothetical protein
MCCVIHVLAADDVRRADRVEQRRPVVDVPHDGHDRRSVTGTPEPAAVIGRRDGVLPLLVLERMIAASEPNSFATSIAICGSSGWLMFARRPRQEFRDDVLGLSVQLLRELLDRHRFRSG